MLNSNQIKTNDEYHLELISDLNKGKINFDEYFLMRGKHRTEKLSELKLIVNDKTLMFNLYLTNVSIGVRVIAMKEIFGLKNEEIALNTGYSKTSITNFIRVNSETYINNVLNKKRQFSIELTYDLSIILDIPYRYIADASAKYKMINSFVEYERAIIKQITMQELIRDTFNETKNKSRKTRIIFGVNIKNDFFNYENMYLNARIDIRKKFFTIEIHLENEASLNFHELSQLEISLKLKNKMYIRNAFLRSNKKLYVLIAIDEDFIPIIPYFDERFLWRNMLC